MVYFLLIKIIKNIMSITCKRVNFNDIYNNVLNILSSTIVDHHCNTIHSIFIQPKYPIECNIEVIGENIHIHKDIPKKQSESSIDYITLITKNIDTPLFIKLIVSKEDMGETSTIIYLGDYMFNVLSFPIHNKVNIFNLITKKIKDIGDESSRDGEQYDDDDDERADDEELSDDEEEDEEEDEEDEEEDEEEDDYITRQKRLPSDEYEHDSGIEKELTEQYNNLYANE
jgi:hypothetical protein